MRKLILILLLACSACTSQAQDPGRKDPGAPAGRASVGPGSADAGGGTLARLRVLAGAAPCTESSQCRTLAVGAMPCGGPESYLPYSTAATDEQALRALGERYQAERQAANKAGGMMSICRHLSDPGAVCVSGSCQLGASSPAVAR